MSWRGRQVGSSMGSESGEIPVEPRVSPKIAACPNGCAAVVPNPAGGLYPTSSFMFSFAGRSTEAMMAMPMAAKVMDIIRILLNSPIICS
jgi:hypothetical protein